MACWEQPLPRGSDVTPPSTRSIKERPSLLSKASSSEGVYFFVGGRRAHSSLQFIFPLLAAAILKPLHVLLSTHIILHSLIKARKHCYGLLLPYLAIWKYDLYFLILISLHFFICAQATNMIIVRYIFFPVMWQWFYMLNKSYIHTAVLWQRHFL